MVWDAMNCARCGVRFSYRVRDDRARKFCGAECGKFAMLGRKQTDEWINKRKRSGEGHHWWLGDDVVEKSGRSRALRAFVAPTACQSCGRKTRLDRHHVNGNTKDNTAENIKFLCRKCHMTEDGRINRMGDVARGNSVSR